MAPGFIETEMVAKIPQPILDGIIEKVPIGRLGRPDEVTRVVRFLLRGGIVIHHRGDVRRERRPLHV